MGLLSSMVRPMVTCGSTERQGGTKSGFVNKTPGGSSEEEREKFGQSEEQQVEKKAADRAA